MRSRIEVVGTGEAAGEPDTARVSLTVNAERADASMALEAVAEAVALVGDAVRAAGVDPADIASTNIQLYSAYDNQGQPTGQLRASHALRIRIASLQAIGAVVTAAVGTGSAVTIDGVALAVGDPTALEDAAREAAYADAVRRAEQVAGLAGREVGDVVRIEESGSGAPRAAFKMAAHDRAASVEPGQQTVQVSLRVIFAMR